MRLACVNSPWRFVWHSADKLLYLLFISSWNFNGIGRECYKQTTFHHVACLISELKLIATKSVITRFSLDRKQGLDTSHGEYPILPVTYAYSPPIFPGGQSDEIFSNCVNLFRIFILHSWKRHGIQTNSCKINLQGQSRLVGNRNLSGASGLTGSSSVCAKACMSVKCHCIVLNWQIRAFVFKLSEMI